MVKNASAGEKAGWFNGRTPLFSQKDLLRLVGPLLVEQFLAVTVGMADTMMVSRCGEAAISGVSLVDMINNLIIVLFAALATGGAVVVSQYLGAKEQEHANASAGQLILLSAVLGPWWVRSASCRPAHDTRLLRQHRRGRSGRRRTLPANNRRQLPVPRAVQRGRGALPQHGQLQNLHADQHPDEHHQHRGQCGLHLRLSMGVDGVAWPSVVSRVIAAVLILNRCYQKGPCLTVPKTFSWMPDGQAHPRHRRAVGL